MERGTLDDLAAFSVVARERSFTRAAARLGLSTSALSYQIKRLERRLGIRLLQRNSRSVATTDAGERLLQTLAPALEDIGEAIDDLGRQRDSVSGTVRITATRQAYEAVIRPVLTEFGASHPDATIEVLIEYEFRDIIESRLDAGIRMGEKLEQDMMALAVSPELRMAVVASPNYLAIHRAPEAPQDLSRHRASAIG
jgi:DNA-binding transcriptional LysR family regulator